VLKERYLFTHVFKVLKTFEPPLIAAGCYIFIIYFILKKLYTRSPYNSNKNGMIVSIL